MIVSIKHALKNRAPAAVKFDVLLDGLIVVVNPLRKINNGAASDIRRRRIPGGSNPAA